MIQKYPITTTKRGMMIHQSLPKRQYEILFMYFENYQEQFYHSQLTKLKTFQAYF